MSFLDKEKEFNQTFIDLVDIKLTDENIIRNLDELRNNRDEELISKIVNNFSSFTEDQKSEINKLLDCILKTPETRDHEDFRVVVGHIIKLSEVLELIKGKNIESLDIYSSKAMIMNDKGLELQGKNVSIITPELYMFGNNKIILDGLNGEDPNPPQADEGTALIPAEPGSPGKAGHSAGNFLGVVNAVYNPAGLIISANGGNGGSGQNGGDGHKGENGKDAPDPETSKKSRILIDSSKDFKPSFGTSEETLTIEYKTEGKLGKKGGDSAVGGIGGFGGKKGYIELLSSNSNSVINIGIEQNEGTQAENGSPGKPGSGGESGKDKLQTYTKVKYIPQRGAGYSTEFWSSITTKDHDPPKVDDGCKPPDGVVNDKDREPPPEAVPMTWYKPLIEYKKCFTENLGNKFLKHNTEEFFSTLHEIQGTLGNNSEIDLSSNHMAEDAV